MGERVPTVLYDLIGGFAWGIPYKQLKEQLDVCHAFQVSVPPSFLKVGLHSPSKVGGEVHLPPPPYVW